MKDEPDLLEKKDNYPCPVKDCPASYTRRHNLKAHFRKNHPQLEKDYPQVFVTLKSTKQGKLWKCPVENCSCGYSRKGDLKYHFIRKHAQLSTLYPQITKPKSSKQNKKYICPIADCDCGYLRKADLKSHFIAKHNDLIHLHPLLKPRDVKVNCLYCSEEFESAELFAQHLTVTHNMNLPTNLYRNEEYDEDRPNTDDTDHVSPISPQSSSPAMNNSHKMHISFLLNPKQEGSKLFVW